MVKVYLDGADVNAMNQYRPNLDGYTTNPSLCRGMGVKNYMEFAGAALGAAGDKPISFEVLADDADTMLKQAQRLAALAPNVWVKIPIIDKDGICCDSVVAGLTASGIKVNVTACFTKQHVKAAIQALRGGHGIVSIFAGRIADTGRDPARLFSYARTLLRDLSGPQDISTLWASTREPLNILHAQRAGADIITVGTEILGKAILLRGKSLDDYARETVQQFSNDAKGITL